MAVNARKVDSSLRLPADVVRVKETGLRSNEYVYRDKPKWREALKALRDSKLKKCANIISKELFYEDKTKVVDPLCLRIADSYVAGSVCVIYQIKCVADVK